MSVQVELIQRWDQKLVELFGGEVPANAEWTSLHQITAVLSGIAGGFNHVFLPDKGGEDLGSCQASSNGLLEWSTREDSLDSHANVCRPIKLTFWNPGPTTREANFVLEVDGLTPVDPDGNAGDESYEEVVEIRQGVYAPRYAWDVGQYQGEPLPDSARLLMRTLNPGRFAVFGKGSIYNLYKDKHFDAYDGFHNDPEQFKNIVATMSSVEI